jgi:cytochrome c peroxidase
MRRAALLAGALLLAASSACAQTPDFTPAEIVRLLRHGPWPPPAAADPSNRVSGDPAAAELGRALFFDKALSADGAFACATCHDPARAWADGKPRSDGRGGPLMRNTPSLADVRLQRWFGWDGARDSLWAASLAPMLSPRELVGSMARTAAVLRDRPGYAACYARAFGRAPGPVDDMALAVDAAKALAAFQATLASGRTPFDEFRDAAARGEPDAARFLSPPARRGAKLFVGRGNCASCHLGPNFTNGEFHDIGVPFFVDGGADPGRHGGIASLRADPTNLLGRWNDDPVRAPGTATRHVEPQHRNFGEFRVPSLRNLARTAPYMHDGAFATLADVVRHYSRADPDRLHADGEALLKPLGLSSAEIDDLVAFLGSLTPSGSAAPGRADSACR